MVRIPLHFLSLASARIRLRTHADPPLSLAGPWGADRGIAAAFGGITGYTGTLDVQKETYFYVASLLEHGVRMLIYAGDVDFACNARGIRKWVEKLQWTGGEGYRNATEKPWFVEGSKVPAGLVRCVSFCPSKSPLGL